MRALFDFQKYGFTNDGTYTCSQCDKSFQCFTEDGDTAFCPCCGTRNMGFEDYNGEEDED